MNPFADAQFLLSVGEPEQLPAPGPAELVFAGRSNVGKSSAINALTGRKRLAFFSKTPGRTQTINFYQLSGGARLVDLPGYGFARVPKPLQEQWQQLVGAYLSSREMSAVVVLMDARHPLTPLDQQLLHWLQGSRVLVLLNKADKLSKAEQRKTLESVRHSLPYATVELFSSLSRQGVEECRGLLAGWLQAGGENKKPPVKGI